MIEDDWTGLSWVAPINAAYQISLNNGAWVGSAKFSVGYDGTHTKEEIVTVADSTVQEFLHALEAAPLKEETYIPSIDHTDDYPSIMISIQTDTDKIAVFSQSQGDGHVPWATIIRDKGYVIDSDIPSRALTAFEPYLKKDVLDALVIDVRNSLAGQ